MSNMVVENPIKYRKEEIFNKDYPQSIHRYIDKVQENENYKIEMIQEQELYSKILLYKTRQKPTPNPKPTFSYHDKINLKNIAKRKNLDKDDKETQPPQKKTRRKLQFNESDSDDESVEKSLRPSGHEEGWRRSGKNISRAQNEKGFSS